MISVTSRRITLIVCLVVVLSMIIADSGSTVLASGKKKFLKGFILGALLSKNHYPVIYQVPAHSAGHSGGHGGYGGGW